MYCPNTEFVITKPTSEVRDNNDDSNNIITRVFRMLFVISVVFCILFAMITIRSVVKVRKTSYSPSDV